MIFFALINASPVEASATQMLVDLPIGAKVVDPSWQWEYRCGNDYTFLPGDKTKPVTWIVVAKDHYGAGSGVTLLSEELIGLHAFDNSTNRGATSGNNRWGDSGNPNATHGLRKFLNGSSYTGGDVNNYNPSFYDSMNASFRNAIVTTTLPNKALNGTEYYTQDKVFIPSTTELGDTEHTYTHKIGTVYPHFVGANNAARQAQLGNFAIERYWTRSPDKTYTYHVQTVNFDGGFCSYLAKNNTIAARPALNLRSDILVSATPDDNGAYEVIPVQIFLCEKFDNWPPVGWNLYQLGASTVNWEHDHIDNYAIHLFSPTSYLNNWLVTPAIALSSLGSITLSFFERAFDMYSYRYSGVWISGGSGNPADGNFVELYESDKSLPNWTEKTIDLSSYKGDTVYIAFTYQGIDGHAWAIDNVCITADTPSSPPTDVTQLSPVQGASVPGENVTFEWEAAPGATKYYLQVMRLYDGHVHFQGDVGNVTQYTSGSFPADGTEYRWRVVAGNAAGWGSFSTATWRMFVSGSHTPPADAVQLTPAHNGSVAGTSATFTWQAVPNATNYFLQILRLSDNQVHFQAGVGNQTSYTVTGFPDDGHEYRWRVVAGNSSAGWGSWVTAEWRILVSGTATAPPNVNLVSPADGSTAAGDSITFTWQAAPRATQYYLQVLRASDNSPHFQASVGNRTSFTVGSFPNNGTVYKWRVVPGNQSAGWGSWVTATWWNVTNQ